jgi:hypothetical protein
MARHQVGLRLVIILTLVALALVAVQRSTLAQTLPPQEDCHRKYRHFLPAIMRSAEKNEQVNDLAETDPGIDRTFNRQAFLPSAADALLSDFQ